eukprot:jgi/Ulvmu1/6460/UM003_0091.1
MRDRCDCSFSGLQFGVDIAKCCLLGVAFLWGTYSVTLRLVYTDRDAPTATVLTALPAIISACALTATAKLLKWQRRSQPDVPDEAEAGSILLPTNSESTDIAPETQSKACLLFLRCRTDSLHIASSELGLYVGLRTLCFTLGCTQVAAVTAAFLLQATNIITPCVASLAGDQISFRIWLGTAAVTGGTVLIFMDRLGDVDQQGAADTGWLQMLGMAAILAAAFFNSLRTFRVSQLAPGFPVLDLAAGQSLMTAIVAVVICVPDIFKAVNASADPRNWADSLWPNWRDPHEVALMLWAGLGCEALAFSLQLYGQRRTAASTAQVIYASVPIWAALWSLLLLSEKGFGLAGQIGACLVVCASVAMGLWR